MIFIIKTASTPEAHAYFGRRVELWLTMPLIRGAFAKKWEKGDEAYLLVKGDSVIDVKPWMVFLFIAIGSALAPLHPILMVIGIINLCVWGLVLAAKQPYLYSKLFSYYVKKNLKVVPTILKHDEVIDYLCGEAFGTA